MKVLPAMELHGGTAPPNPLDSGLAVLVDSPPRHQSSHSALPLVPLDQRFLPPCQNPVAPTIRSYHVDQLLQYVDANGFFL